jgi:hypothetical protein
MFVVQLLDGLVEDFLVEILSILILSVQAVIISAVPVNRVGIRIRFSTQPAEEVTFAVEVFQGGGHSFVDMDVDARLAVLKEKADELHRYWDRVLRVCNSNVSKSVRIFQFSEGSVKVVIPDRGRGVGDSINGAGDNIFKVGGSGKEKAAELGKRSAQ